MQSQYTDKARTALILAEKAARKLKQNYVGTEHILLGLLEEGTGVAARVLIENGANELEIREMIEDLIAPVQFCISYGDCYGGLPHSGNLCAVCKAADAVS